MRASLLKIASKLASAGEPFVIASVVRRDPPSSARVGDAALISRTGEFHGWLGGSCTQPVVVREALSALKTGEPRLIALVPDPDSEVRPGIRTMAMTCHSGGSVEIYIEPMLPPPRLFVFGDSPPGKALVRLADIVGYKVFVVDPSADETTFPEADRVLPAATATDLRSDNAPTFVVVATLGERDEEAIRLALDSGAAYVGLVASRKRFEEINARLRERGVSAEALATVESPAGMDIGALTPPEIALSVLTQIVQRHRTRSATADAIATKPTKTGARPSDPVCGMTVDPATASVHTEYGGETYYFCCEGCRERFRERPESFVGTGTGKSR
ncbi:MAG: XdhC family protein [Acidobacteriota bacterium]|nr:XdhC family protein [Acidobacteriota bacterium]